MDILGHLIQDSEIIGISPLSDNPVSEHDHSKQCLSFNLYCHGTTIEIKTIFYVGAGEPEEMKQFREQYKATRKSIDQRLHHRGEYHPRLHDTGEQDYSEFRSNISGQNYSKMDGSQEL